MGSRVFFVAWALLGGGLGKLIYKCLTLGNFLVLAAGHLEARMSDRLDAMIEKLKALPQDRIEEVLEILDAAIAGPLELSPEELEVLLPALDAAKRGEFASEETVQELLDKPWR